MADDPPRIVSLHDVTTEILVALGAVDRLVGARRPIQVPPEVGAAVAQIPRVGDTESIVASRPTLVLGTSVVAREAPDLVNYLRDVGIEVVLLDPRGLDDVYNGVIEVARRAKVPDAGAMLVARLRGRSGGRASAAPESVRIFVYDCCDPPFTAARRTASLLSTLRRRRGLPNPSQPHAIPPKDGEYDRLAATLREHIDLGALRRIAGRPTTRRKES